MNISHRMMMKKSVWRLCESLNPYREGWNNLSGKNSFFFAHSLDFFLFPVSFFSLSFYLWLFHFEWHATGCAIITCSCCFPVFLSLLLLFSLSVSFCLSLLLFLGERHFIISRLFYASYTLSLWSSSLTSSRCSSCGTNLLPSFIPLSLICFVGNKIESHTHKDRETNIASKVILFPHCHRLPQDSCDISSSWNPGLNSVQLFRFVSVSVCDTESCMYFMVKWND